MAIFLILGAAVVLVFFQNQQKIVYSQHQLIAQDAVNTVRDFFTEKIVAMETTARLANPAAGSRDERKRAINYLFNPHTAFRQLVLIDSKKQRIAEISRLSQSGATGLLNDRILEDSFTQTARGIRYMSEVMVDMKTREPMIVIAVPVKDVFGTFQGLLAAEVNLKFMWDLVGNITIGETGLAYVVDRRGKLIAYRDISRVLKGENVGNIGIVNKFIHNPVSVNTAHVDTGTGIQGTTVIGSYVFLMEPDFAVVTEQSVMEAYQAVVRFLSVFLAFTIVMWGLTIFGAVRLARSLSVPLVNLMNVAVRIAGGERGLRAEVSGPVEIARVAEAFNSMTAQLNDVIDNLEQRGAYLQRTVQRYVEYMIRVGNGDLDGHVQVEGKDGDNKDPLIILGQQLNDTTLNLKRKIEQIQETTRRLEINEEQLKEYANKLERSNRELDQFASVASHDLQEPLRKFMYFSESLKENYGARLDEKGLEHLERMTSATVRMEKLIKGLLEYSQVRFQATPFEKVDLNEIVKGVLEDLEIKIRETNAGIKTERLPVLEANPLQMRQLFQNLIGNAIKYKREAVPPLIKIHSVITADGGDTFCEIRVIDNGIGFDNAFGDEIFGLFKRLHGRKIYEGAGIGLAICKKIVEQHRGTISAFSRKGEGATFRILLPCKQNNGEGSSAN